MTVDLEQLAQRIDRVLAHGLRREWMRRLEPARVDGWEWAECVNELRRLPEGCDACYDRPGMPFAYGSWYHGQRMTECLSLLQRFPLSSADGRTERVLDLGSGTGSVPWAIALDQVLRRPVAGARNRFLVTCCDSSWPMIEVAKALWAGFVHEFSDERVDDMIRVEWKLDSWANCSEIDGQFDAVIAHYLFDHSELRHGASADTIDLFVRRLSATGARRFVSVTTEAKASKLHSGIRDALSRVGWSVHSESQSFSPRLRGDLRKVGEFRRERSCEVPDHELRIYGGRLPRFDQSSNSAGLVLGEFVGGRRSSAPAFELTSEQQAAVQAPRGYVKLKGAAGSGKTEVLCRRLVGFARQRKSEALAPGNSAAESLVICFNKPLLEFVYGRLQALLRQDGFICVSTPVGSWNGESNQYRISLMEPKHHIHLFGFDALVSRVFNSRPGPGKSDLRDQSLGLLRQASASDLRHIPVTAFPMASVSETSIHGRSLDRSADFLVQEYERTFYGQAGLQQERYRGVKRVGRGHGLGPDARKAVIRFLERMSDRFLVARSGALVAELSATTRTRFHDVFVDEAQDFSAVDYEILERIVAPGAGLTVAFDPSQAIFRGPAFSLPKRKPSRTCFLGSSFRMPLRLCEALQPVVEYLNREHRSDRAGAERDDEADEDGLAITPRPSRLSVLGARPILIATKTCEDFVRRLHGVRLAMADPSRRDDVAVFEADEELERMISNQGAFRDVTGKSVLRVKGREFPWVVWSTRSRPKMSMELHRFCYTALSRCNGHAVIWLELDRHGLPDRSLAPIFAKGAPGALRRDRILPWDREAQEALKELDGPVVLLPS